MHRILVVEDNKIANTILTKTLQKRSYHVVSVFDAEHGLQRLELESFDLVILDLGLPNMSGYAFLEAVHQTYGIPIIISTANTSVANRVNLIHQGAMDYITKPINPNEILESIQTVLDNTKPAIRSKEAVYYLYDMVVDSGLRTVRKQGVPLELTVKEFRILLLLLSNPDKAIKKETLYQLIWFGEYDANANNTINVHIRRLRRKLDDDTNPVIETIWNYGYRLHRQARKTLSTEQAT